MSFKCQEVGCGKVIRTVGDVRACERCRLAGRSAARTGGLPEHHADDDVLTPVLLGALLSSAFSHHDAEPEPFTGGGGESAGGGASGSFDVTPEPSPVESSSPDSTSGGDNP